MKVEISIADDTELRAHIKDVIKGEVVSIARGEIRKIIAEVCGTIASEYSKEKADAIAKDIVLAEVKKQFASARYGEPSYVQSVIREKVSEMFREILTYKTIA